MRIFFGFLISTFALTSCVQKHETSNQAVTIIDNIPCKRSVLLKKANNETVSICLPEMETLKDCLLDSVLKKEFSNIIPIEKFNVLAVYESDSMYNVLKKQEPGNDILKNYYILTYDKDNYSLDQFNEVLSKMKSSFINKEWKGVREKINEDVGEKFKEYYKGLKFEQPLLVGNYKLSDNCATYIMLVKVNGLIQVSFGNFILFNKTVVHLFYYSIYQNHNTIELEQRNNDYLVHELLNINKY